MGNVLQRPAGALNADEYIILVGNIPWRGRWQDLKDLVREITPHVQRVEIYTTPDGRSRGFGYIIVKEREEAIKVAERLDGFEWHGRALMVKLGNGTNPVPVLAQQPNLTSSPDGSLPTEYLPVPPLPTDYDSNANFSGLSNLAASQLAAYNEWIAIQAYYHYSALAHNIGVLIQEGRSQIQQQIASGTTPNEWNTFQANLQRLNLGDGATAAISNPTATQERETLLEEYSRQAGIAQRAATYHSTRHHALLQEERSRFQDNSPPNLQSSSSSSAHSSNSPFSMVSSRRGTPNQPSTSVSPPDLAPTSTSQQKFHSPSTFVPMMTSPSPLNMPSYLSQRAMSDHSLRRGSYPFFHSTPIPHSDSPQQFYAGQVGPGFQPYPTAMMTPAPFNYGETSSFPSFYPTPSSNQYPMLPMGPSSPPVATSHHAGSHHAGSHHAGSHHQQSQSDSYQPQYPNSGPRCPSHTHSLVSVAVPPTPMFITTTSGVPVNLTHGAVQTENRGIFIGNLPYNTHWRDLRTFLASAGTVIRCDVPRKPNNKGRGYATVLFSSTEEANRACELFNGATFQGRQIRVRLDTYANTKTSSMVDGTTGSGSAGSGSGGNQSSIFTDGDVDQEGKQSEQTGRKSAASV